MKAFRIGLFLVLIAVLLFCTNALAERRGTCGDNLTWVLDDAGNLTISGTGGMAVYPSTGPWGKSVKTVVIESGVTSISSFAFRDCSGLTSITISESVTRIGENALCGCSSLTSVTVPSSVTSISNGTFSGCRGLTSIAIPEGITSIGDNAFSGCSGLTSVTIPEGVTSIGQYAFYSCSSLTSVTIPDSVTSIGDYAFNGCSSLTSLTIPEGVTSIGNCAFSGCSDLTSLTIPESVTSFGISTINNCNSLNTLYHLGQEIHLNGVDKSGVCGTKVYWIFKDKELIIYGIGPMKNYTYVPLSGNKAPWSSYDIENVVILDGVSSIGNSAFYGCRSLLNITIPDSVRSIGASGEYSGYSFYGCSKLTSISIPDSVRSIYPYTFQSCTGLTSIILPGGISIIYYYTFSGCTNLESVVIPDGVKTIYTSAFQNCSSLVRIDFPDSVTTIDSTVIEGCDAVFYANPESNAAMIISKRDRYFRVPSGDYSLKYIYTDEVRTGLKLRDVDKEIGYIALPNDVTSIEDSAFKDCNSLEKLTIPTSVTSIGSNAFSGCENLVAICILGNNTDFGEEVLSKSATIYCYEFSDAESWATDNGYPVVLLDDLNMDDIRTLSLLGDMRLACGKSIDINATIFPNDGAEIVWTSSDPGVASVDNKGTVTALSRGAATITASVGSVSDSMEIEVYIAPERFGLNSTEAWLVAKEGLQLSIVNIEPDGAEVDPVWTSSDATIATVDNGLVTTKKPGDVTITATSDGIARECLIHLFYPVTAIAFEQNEIELVQDQSFQLTANVSARTQATVNRLVSFESSDTFVATVDADGMVTARKTGTASITATAASGVTASCAVTVREAHILILPAGLTAIEAEAFMGDLSIEAVIVPDGCATIGERAFAGCENLIYVRIPAGLSDIADSAFEGCDQARIERSGE